MTLGWLRAAAACASARNRLRNAASSASDVVQHLHRDAPLQRDVVGEEHGGGRPGADGREQPVAATEHLTDSVVSERSHRDDATAG